MQEQSQVFFSEFFSLKSPTGKMGQIFGGPKFEMKINRNLKRSVGPPREQEVPKPSAQTHNEFVDWTSIYRLKVVLWYQLFQMFILNFILPGQNYS